MASVCSAATIVVVPDAHVTYVKYRNGLSEIDAVVDLIVHNKSNYTVQHIKENWATGKCYWNLVKFDLSKLTITQLSILANHDFLTRLKSVMTNIWPSLANWKYEVIVTEGVVLVQVHQP